MLTKKRLTVISIFMLVIYFGLALIFRESVIGRGEESLMMFVSKLVFLSTSATITTAFLLIFIFKKELIQDQFATFNRYKHLLRLMVKRDFVARYRKSVLGVLWSLLHPLMMMLVLTAVFSFLFDRQIENFPVYLLSGLIIYEFINESTTTSMTSIINNEGVIKKVYVPKYIFPLSRVISSLVQLGFSFLALIAVMVITGASFKITMLLLPVPILYTFIFAFGVAMLLAAMAVFFRDVMYLYSVLMRMLFFLTPIMYPMDMLPEWLRPFMGLNPIFQFIDYFRDLVLYGMIPGLWDNVVCLSFAMMALCVGIYAFISRQDKFILYL
ncbi:MAG: ABC transporter permease [Clostridiales bacterium]|nr:ABC transporter permease [Clostridiales bacterium]